MKYQSVECSSVFKVFGNDFESKLRYAYIEDELQVKSAGKAPIFGNLQCFCIEEHEAGHPEDKLYRVQGSDS